METVQQWQKKYSKAEDIPDSELPENFDLRNINGYDFVGPVRDQRGCGSCYTQSFLTIVESRLKMIYGRDSG